MNNTDNKIQEIDSLTLLQFYAEWCYPCKMMMPVVNTLKNKLENWLNVHQVDVDEEQNMAIQYRVRAVPTFVVLKTIRRYGVTPEYFQKISWKSS